MKEIGVVSWKFPHEKGLANIFAKFYPSENNQPRLQYICYAVLRSQHLHIYFFGVWGDYPNIHVMSYKCLYERIGVTGFLVSIIIWWNY